MGEGGDQEGARPHQGHVKILSLMPRTQRRRLGKGLIRSDVHLEKMSLAAREHTGDQNRCRLPAAIFQTKDDGILDQERRRRVGKK